MRSNSIFNFDFVDSLAALGIAQASLALLSFAKEFNFEFSKPAACFFSGSHAPTPSPLSFPV